MQFKRPNHRPLRDRHRDAALTDRAAAFGSGFVLGKSRTERLLDQKKKRMRIIAANGLFVMIPSALFLNYKAAAGEFDVSFYAVQLVELVVGAVQITLMGMNFRDGRRLATGYRSPIG